MDKSSYKTIEAEISEIIIEDRFRKDYGDLQVDADSIAELGLLQPIGITKDKRLVFGERRLLACRDILGWKKIPARIVPVDLIVLGQVAENMRKDYTISERVAIVEALNGYRHGGDRRSDQVPYRELGLTLDQACKRAGFGMESYYRAKRIVECGTDEVTQSVDSGELSLTAGDVLVKASLSAQRKILRRQKAAKDLTARALAREVRKVDREQCVEPIVLNGSPSICSVTQGDCQQLIPALPDGSIDLCFTSPPYAEQRNGHYPGIPECEYPGFTVDWMNSLSPKLTENGSVLLNIDPHTKNGVVSDYVLRLQLALRDAGWNQHRTQIWRKGGLPLAPNSWPRHSYEEIMWFSKTKSPFCNPKAVGPISDRVPIRGTGGSQCENGPGNIARVSDVIDISVALNENGIDHPARFPVQLAEQIIATFCPEGGTVLDAFAGSGSSLVAAKMLGRAFYGFEIMAEYVEMSNKRLGEALFNEPSIDRESCVSKEDSQLLKL